ncbi:hypothetical protein SAMN04488062_12028 [Flavobacterium omnivorum]|uniref:Uncharacterized protein n=1 Tax=Flavobacterium omnivorum TaxID=178355 RepID=A0A1G8H4W3_9FLAO|nr:hypothetical protein [Flavobacterium omnivorum]SDI01697.1 hypothetical protein SAMN04488062_12028 [Flavobacterium omnivorum]
MSKKKQQEYLSIIDIIIGVFAVIGIIFFIGELFEKSKESKTKEIDTIPEKSIDKKKRRLNEVETNIEVLSPRRNQLDNTEKKIHLWSRIIIAVGFIGINLGYLFYSNWIFDLGSHLNLNGAIALVYTFFGFIIYGSPDILVKEIKEKSRNRLKRKHIHILSELEGFEKEREVLLIEIKGLEVVEQNNLILIEQPVEAAGL